jgi:chemotaxis methyl-accepting protein methylase/Flp pilus assembly protein TadD
VTAHALAQLIERTTGLDLERGGVSTALDRFVTERLRDLGLARIEDYIALAADPRGPEQRKLIDAITVPHTWFYRDPDQLHTIGTLMLSAPQPRLHVWIAGCATGEEAYTIAMIGRRIGRPLSVLATDVNETALAAARRGIYGANAVRDVPELDRRWLLPRDNGFAVDEELRASVTFERHNLVDPPPIGPSLGWDLVLCRNVLIYFAQAASARVFKRFSRAVREGGSVVVGASEVVFEPPAGLELVSSGNRLVLRRPLRGKPTVRSIPVRTSTQMIAAQPPPRELADPPVRETRDEDLVAALARGHALFERGEIGAAVPIYADLARRYAQNAEPWLFLGIAQYAHGDVDAAADALRAALCLNPALWPAGFYLARAYERLGRRADALQQYDRIAVDDLQPLALQSVSAVINELRAFQHDFRTAARRVAADRIVWPRGLLK